MRKFAVIVALVSASSFELAASSAFQDVITLRQSRYREIGTAFKAINDEQRKAVPMRFLVNSSVARIAKLAGDQGSWFPAGSGPESGVKTRAKSDIWAKPAEFAAAQRKLTVESSKLLMLSKGNDAAAFAAQVKEVGTACAGCHRAFRAEE